MEASLTAKIKVLESNYFFLQKEHSILIKGLHEEIEKLQRKYSELAFDYIIRSNKSLETLLLEDKIKQLQSSINEKNEELISQKEKLNHAHETHHEKEVKLLKQIEDQKNTIQNLREIISQRSSLNNGDESILEKSQKIEKETQTEKTHKRKKKKSANAYTSESGNSCNRAVERSSSRELKTKVLPAKTTKSAASATSPIDKTRHISSSDHESFQKKGKRDKRNRKKNCTPPLYVGDIPVLPSDYRAVVATLPPIQTHEGTELECDMHKFIPCSSGRHSAFSTMKGNVNPLTQLHKGLQKPPLKVEGFN